MSPWAHPDSPACPSHALVRALERGEESGLLSVTHGDPEYADYIADVASEHRELAALLPALDLSDPGDVRALVEDVDEPHRHIAKEEDGLLPAWPTALDGDEWNRAMATRRAAHPA
ncbi:hemerythrin domain-containing protein [Streptomyces sp. NPDC058257]|uniref:hemerythrin domain-containing protein n=1 Tax=Streptomyces sp. NPDC058257 TaxID=3346409 RepID=UPI0036E224FF